MKIIWEIRSVGDDNWILFRTKLKFEVMLTIKDIHPGFGGDEIHPMQYSKFDALKLKRFLNNFYTGSKHRFHWSVFDCFKRKLKLTTGTYYRSYE